MNWNEMLKIATGFSSDSRALRAGDIFVALRGEKSDGGAYAADVLKRGALGVVADKGFASRFPDVKDSRVIESESAHELHRELAAHFRRRFKGTVIAVGGSNGKTTTKEFLAAILAAHRPTVKTEKSQNGELGIPRTLEKLREGVEAAVIEVGIDGPGDMVRHASLVAPDVALLTSIGEEHLNLLKTVDNVFAEERILADETLARGGRVYAPASDPYLARLSDLPGVILTPARPEDIDPSLRCSLGHPKALQNAALAARVALDLGVPKATVAAAIAKLEVPEGRGRELRLRPDLLVLADHYNANMASMKAGIAYAKSVAAVEKLPLKLVLGDMLDLGDSADFAHDEVLREAAAVAPAFVLLVGPQMSARAASLASQLAAVNSVVSSSPDSASAESKAQELLRGSAVLLVKGSRGTQLERVLKAMGVPA
jgi:UDP-N-acetylmuramyl pentapeptide synthase